MLGSAKMTKGGPLGVFAAVEQGMWKLAKEASYHRNYCCFTGKLQTGVGLPGATNLSRNSKGGSFKKVSNIYSRLNLR